MNNKNIESIKPAAKPGLHSSSENIAKEYLKETVKKRLKFLISSQNWSKKKLGISISRAKKITDKFF